jgi:hypothetical protein
MFTRTTTRIAAVGLVAAAIAGLSATAAFAAPVPTGSEGPVYIYDAGNETRFADNFVFAYDAEVVASLSPTAATTPFVCPAASVTTRTFVTPVGTERTISSWTSYADGGFNPGTKQVIEPSANLLAQILGSQAAVKAAGGNYSYGIACLKDNNVNFASSTLGVWFTTIHVTAGTGAWTVDVPDSTVVTPPTPSSGSFNSNLQATTIAAADGTLNLVAPASATVLIGNPTLVNHLSTSTGTLGNFTVQDGRVVTHPGWTLATTVTDFTNASDATVTIGKAQLGIKPVAVSSTAAGVTIGAEQVAGSGVYPAGFASADNSAAVGNSVFNANLTFVAPANKPAGTYNSVLTITLASK